MNILGFLKRLCGRGRPAEEKAPDPKPEEKPPEGTAGVLEEVKPEEPKGDAPKEGQ
jgi:hypothetical protein